MRIVIEPLTGWPELRLSKAERATLVDAARILRAARERIDPDSQLDTDVTLAYGTLDDLTETDRMTDLKVTS